MQVRRLIIQNFRGIEQLDWCPGSPLVCLIGSGDVGKTTILDAIEAALSSRWMTFSDIDFYQCDTQRPIDIKVTIGELPPEARNENRFGLYLRGWTKSGQIHDEPEDDDEAVVTVQLTVDASLEPNWQLATYRGETKTLSQRDRSLFGVVRLGEDVGRHLTWGQGSALSRISTEKAQAASILAAAYRTAREQITSGSLPELDAIAGEVLNASVQLGAYSGTAFAAGLDAQRASMSLGALALHSEDVPVRLSGLGTRRLVALAVQRLSVPDGAIVLVDEIEHGLEPHRVRHALKFLRDDIAGKSKLGRVGQVILTSHSPTAVVELSHAQLTVARSNMSP